MILHRYQFLITHKFILLCLYREPQIPRRPLTTGPKPHQLKIPTPKPNPRPQSQNPKPQTIINNQIGEKSIKNNPGKKVEPQSFQVNVVISRLYYGLDGFQKFSDLIHLQFIPNWFWPNSYSYFDVDFINIIYSRTWVLFMSYLSSRG